MLCPFSVQSGKKIKDNFEKEKVQKVIKELEQTNQLTNDETKEKINLNFTAYSKNLKQNLENMFSELNRGDFITSKQMYNDTLKLFYVKIRKVHKGHLIFVTDGNGNPVRHRIKMSDFDERSRFYQPKERVKRIEFADGNSKFLFDLIRLIPNYQDKYNFKKKKELIKKRRNDQRIKKIFVA
jgi:phosphoenolpyruvate carboxylase